jgi:predicted dehydrogenase
LFEAEPVRAVALLDRDAELGIDRSTSGLLDFGAGRQLSFSVSTQCCSHQRVTVLGARGRIEMEIPFNAPPGAASRIRIDETGALDGSGITVETLPEADHYQRMVEDFTRTVRGEPAPFWGLDDAVAQMAVIDALRRSEHSGTWEPVQKRQLT